MGSFYLEGKNSIFWLLIDSLVDEHIFRKDVNVLPFTPLKPQQFIDFIPFPAGTSLDVLIDGKFVLSTLTQLTSNVNISRVDFEAFLPYTRGAEFKLELKLSSNGQLIKIQHFSTWQLYLFYEVIAKEFQQSETRLTEVKDNSILSTAGPGSLFPNFGIFFDLKKRFDQTSDEYRDVLSSFYIAFLNSATVKGIDTALEDLTGFLPVIQTAKEQFGWRIFSYYKYPNTFLTSSVTGSVSTTIPVLDTTFFPSTFPFNIQIGIDTFSVTSKTTLSFIGTTPIANSHSIGTPVIMDQDPTREHMFAKKVTTLSADILAGVTTIPVVSTKDFSNKGTLIFKNGDLFVYTSKTGTSFIGPSGIGHAHSSGEVVFPKIVKAILPSLGERILPPIKPFSVQAKVNLVFIIMNASDIIRNVLNEPIVKSGMGLTDFVSNQTLTDDPLIITDPANTFLENTDFTVDRLTGGIIWPSLGLQPTTGSTYKVSYKFELILPIVKVIKQLKPAFRKVIFEVNNLDGTVTSISA